MQTGANVRRKWLPAQPECCRLRPLSAITRLAAFLTELGVFLVQLAARLAFDHDDPLRLFPAERDSRLIAGRPWPCRRPCGCKAPDPRGLFRDPAQRRSPPIRALQCRESIPPTIRQRHSAEPQESDCLRVGLEIREVAKMRQERHERRSKQKAAQDHQAEPNVVRRLPFFRDLPGHLCFSFQSRQRFIRSTQL